MSFWYGMLRKNEFSVIKDVLGETVVDIGDEYVKGLLVGTVHLVIVSTSVYILSGESSSFYHNFNVQWFYILLQRSHSQCR